MQSNARRVITGKDARLFEVITSSQGHRLWINADDGSSVARFNCKTGVDLHNTVTDQMAGEPQCLWCTHSKPDYVTWQSFTLKVWDLYGIQLSDGDIDISLLQ